MNNFSEVIDISWPISPSMTAYKDRSVVKFQPTKVFEQDNVREALITLGTHSGTHVDAAAHFVREGGTIDNLALSNLVGPCTVFDLSHVQGAIEREHLEGLEIQQGSIILFKTTNSSLDPQAGFTKNFVYISAQAAEFLATKKLRAVGVDYLGVERGQPDHETHIQLFDAGTAIVEGLRLQAVQPSNYFFCCLPLLLEGLEAAPARAVLMK